MKTTAAAALALSMLAVPAFAQSSATSPSNAAAQHNGTATNPSSATSGPEFKAMTQAKLKQQLSQAGFSSIDVLDASYLVQAKTPDGNTVIMVINPPSMNTASNGALNSNVTTGSVGSSSTSGKSGSMNANNPASGSGSNMMSNPSSNATGATVPHPGATK